MPSPYEEGDPSSKLLVLGEAPSGMEMRLRRPLVGPSGDVFKDCLHAAGITRNSCYILNVFPFPVTRDKGQNILDGSTMLWHHKYGMTEDGEEAAAETLERIRVAGANCILSLGSTALDFLMTGHRPIMKWRGSPLWSDRVHKKVVPTVHPAATIHGVYVWRHLITNDMAKVMLDVPSPEVKLTPRNLMISPTFSDVHNYVEKCRAAKKFATDIEVMNHQVSCFSLSCDPSEALTVPLVGPKGGPYWDDEDEESVWMEYASLMSDPKVMKVNHNLMGFDAVFLLLQNNIHTIGPLGDTMIAHSIMYPDFPMGLDFLASYHTREPYWKDDGKIWKKMTYDWDVFQRYCGRDSAVALELWDILEKEMEEGDYRTAYDMTIRMAGPLAYMSVRGLKVDNAGLEITKVKLEAAIVVKEAELAAAVDGETFSVASPKQCAEYFYNKLGIKPYVNAMGGITTDDKAMSRIFRRGGPGAKEAKIVQELRALKKLKGTYIDVILDTDSRLRCSWNPRGTWTGRLSSSKTILGTGMNLQNLHPEFKGFIVAG